MALRGSQTTAAYKAQIAAAFAKLPGAGVGPLVGVPAARADTAVGWVSLEPEDVPALAILCELGDSAPDATGGFGGWTIVERQRDKALTSWQGFQPLSVELEMWIDGHAIGRAVDAVVDNLEAMAGRGRKRLPGQPPLLIVDTGGVMRHDATVFPTVRWVIQDLSWDRDQAIIDANGHRMRAVATVTLLEHVDAARLRDRSLERRIARQRKTEASSNVYVARDGDTLISIARKKLHDPGRWPELARLNKIRDPLAIKRGARIRLP